VYVLLTYVLRATQLIGHAARQLCLFTMKVVQKSTLLYLALQYIDSQLPVPLPYPFFTPNFITVILFTTRSYDSNNPSLPNLLELLLKLLNSVVSFPSYAIWTGSKSLNAATTSSSHLQSPHNYLTLHISITTPMFNLLTALTHSSSLFTLARPPTSSS